jgi:pyruvate formate lyase activating enzyme
MDQTDEIGRPDEIEGKDRTDGIDEIDETDQCAPRGRLRAVSAEGFLAMKEAMLYEKRSASEVRCLLCNHRCLIEDGKSGVCRVRLNRGGTLYSLVYGKVVAENIDPIEKKPLFHVRPGTSSYSIATCGCNFRCLHCQNHEISQMPREAQRIVGFDLAPEEAVKRALGAGCSSISYTYTEPTIYFEYALDVAKLAREKGLLNVFVTNGYMTQEALAAFHPFLDAANVDLKAATDEFYRRICGARVEPVRESIRAMRRLGIWVEVTTLIIPGLNDDPEGLREIARFLLSVGPEVPWHVSAFHPTYRLTDRPRTPVDTLRRAREIGLKEGLRFVYSGNVPGEEGENTSCPACGEGLIRRFGFRVLENRIRQGRCPECGTAVEGLGL